MSATAEETLAALNFGPVPSLEATPAEVKVQQAVEADEQPELTAEEQEMLYAEAASLKAAKEKIDERLDAIKATFRRLDYGTTTVHAAAGGKVTVGHNPVFNELRFLDEFPYDAVRIVDEVVEVDGQKRIVETTTYPNRDLYKITPDRTAIKKEFTEDAYKALFDEGDKKITIK